MGETLLPARAPVQSPRFSASEFLASYADLVVLAAGFLYETVYLLLTYHLGWDDTNQLAAGLSWARGGGLGPMAVKPSDLSAVHYHLIYWWPPGYSILTGLFFKLSRDAYLTAVGTELIGYLLLGAAIGLLLYRLRKGLSLPARLLIACVVGWWGPQPSTSEHFTNVWALALFLGGAAFLLPLDEGREPSSISTGMGGVLLALTVGLRWAYGPVSVAVALAGVCLGWRGGARRQSVATIVGWMLGIAPLVGWKFFYAGNPDLGRTRFTGHVFWSNLRKFHAFAADALFGPRLVHFFPASCYKLRDSVDPLQFALAHLLSVVVIAGAVVGAVHAKRLEAKRGDGNVVSRFFMIGLVTVLTNCLFLTVLSLINVPETALASWTYVCEPRYFSVGAFFILAGVAVAATAPHERLGGVVFRTVLAALFGFSAVLWLLSVSTEVHEMRQGSIGGPVDRYLPDQGQFLKVVRRYSSGKPTTYLEIGVKFDFKFYLRQAEATIIDVPSAFVHPNVSLATSHERQVLYVLAPTDDPRHVPDFDRLCVRRSGDRLDDGGMHFCGTTMSPVNTQPVHEQ